MNVLIVDEEVPWPLDTGKRLRSYNLLQRLQRDHSITYLCYGTPAAVLPDCPNVNVITLPSPVLEQKGFFFYWSLLVNLLSPRPYIVDRHYSAALADKVSSLVATGDFDLLHCEWTPYTENILSLFGKIPTVLSAHNVEAQIWERYYQTEVNPPKKAYIYLQWQKLLRYEAAAAQRYTAVSTVSEPDSTIFIKQYGCRQVQVVPNGVDEQYFAPIDSTVQLGSMVFTGSMDWRPNQDGVKYFIEEVFPLIRQRVTDATFTVVGRRPPQWLIGLVAATDGVTVTGTVDDVRPYIARSALYVVPLRVGGGSRLKILEALAMEKIVLSTSVGAEGLAVEEGKTALLRDTPKELAEIACQVLTDPARFQQLGKKGRDLIMQQYTWDAITKTMAALWERARG
ncbi:MAG: glycosyltransferase family 4 protein [Geobacteraceae bacterium]|nr:glycosyltransferase family 4 protein [Geobacteraceae bacterium]